MKSAVRPQQEQIWVKLPIYCAVAGFLFVFVPEHTSKLWLNDSWRKAVHLLLQMLNSINIVRFSCIVSLVLFNCVDSCRQQQRCKRKLEQNHTDLQCVAPHFLGFDSTCPPQTILCIPCAFLLLHPQPLTWSLPRLPQEWHAVPSAWCPLSMITLLPLETLKY